MRVLIVALSLLALAGCASTPTNIDNVCSVFDQKDGWFSSWYGEAKDTQKEYGVPVSILMATLYKESGFQADAKPPRTHLLWIIPWTRPTSAYGYPQALDSTWAWYQRSTGRYGADRDNFGDAVEFVGWYYHLSHERNGIPLNDAYHLYISYYVGQGGYAAGVWKHNAHIKRIARTTARMADRYAAQMRLCGK